MWVVTEAFIQDERPQACCKPYAFQEYQLPDGVRMSSETRLSRGQPRMRLMMVAAVSMLSAFAVCASELVAAAAVNAGSAVPNGVPFGPPPLVYDPSPAAPLTLSGVTTVGSTGSGSILAIPGGGTGTGPANTTTVNNCIFTGADAAAFSGAAAISLIFEGATTTSQPMTVSCVSGFTARVATLSCRETRGLTPPAVRSWMLFCPAGNGLPLTSVPPAGSEIALPVALPGDTRYAELRFQNPNPSAVSLTCTLGAGGPFAVAPATLTIPAGGAGSTQISFQASLPSVYSTTLVCTTSRGQLLSYPVSAQLVSAAPVPGGTPAGLLLLATTLLTLGLYGHAATRPRQR